MDDRYFGPTTWSDEEWQDISQQVPKETDPFVQKYLEGREALVAQENAQRSGV